MKKILFVFFVVLFFKGVFLMAVTQIVSVLDNKSALKDSLKRISTKKVVFLASRENIKRVIGLRNEFALDTKLPTEVRAVARNYSGLVSVSSVTSTSSVGSSFGVPSLLCSVFA